MKILIIDPVPKKLIENLISIGYDVTYLPDLSYEALKNTISEYNVLILRGRVKIDAKILENAKKLNKIIRFGVGLDNIDINVAKEKGVNVYNTPNAFIEAVAELTLTLILGVLRGIGKAHYGIKSGKWLKKELIGNELYKKTVGIIGFGRIGRRLYELLKPFNVNVLVYDVIKIPNKYIKEGVIQVKDIYELARRSDVITIHVPLTKGTYKMIDEHFLSTCKTGVYIINTSRGEVIDKDALIKFIKNGKISGIAFDVYWEEPFTDAFFMKLDNALYTPHIGAQTYEARERAVDEVIKILRSNR